MSMRHYVPAMAALAAALLAIGGPVAADGATSKKTIGLVLTSWAPAVYQAPDGKEKDECPEGLHSTNKDNWKLQFPTEEQRADFNRRRVHLGPGVPGGIMPDLYLQNRGPNGENITYNPTLVKDQLPLREVQGKISYGLNLDGTTDGRATAKTCKHDKFVSPEGEPGIDNQMYRILGCSSGWRKGGFNVSFHATQFRQRSLNRWLIEISGVDDELNDKSVDVTIYKGIDRIVTDANLKPIAGLTQRIDVRFPKYISKTKGKIVDGVLITEPVDHYHTLFELTSENRRYLRGMRLKLKLNETGASGMIAAYEDLDEWWFYYSKSYIDVVDSIGRWSPPALHEAAYRLADGYPDPRTGQCTAISTAYRVDAVRAFIVKPSPNDPLARQAALVGRPIAPVRN
jgi:hypothetical protein